jgi:transcription antitermination factor NusG
MGLTSGSLPKTAIAASFTKLMLIPAENVCHNSVQLMEMPGELPWYALRTKPKHERTACVGLAGKNYNPYLPMYRSRRRWSDRVVESELPFFPGYVFCRFDAQRRLPVLTTPGVIDVLGFGSHPVPVPDCEVEAIQTILRSGLPAEPCLFLREGQRIRMTAGPLEGLEGILLQKMSDWRMVVSVEMLQRSLSVEVDYDCFTTL